MEHNICIIMICKGICKMPPQQAFEVPISLMYLVCKAVGVFSNGLLKFFISHLDSKPNMMSFQVDFSRLCYSLGVVADVVDVRLVAGVTSTRTVTSSSSASYCTSSPTGRSSTRLLFPFLFLSSPSGDRPK
jgi:hypothetical protein